MGDAALAAAQPIRKRMLLFLWVVLFSACSRHPQPSQPSPQTSYEAARLKFQHGDLIGAQADAKRAYQNYAQESTEWGWRFRVLQAEILLWKGLSKESLAQVDIEMPSSLSTDEAAVRRKLVQGLANGFLSQYADAERRLVEGEQLALANQPKLLGEIVLAQGTLFVLRNDYPSAKPKFQSALEFARREKQSFLEANALGSLGLVSMGEEHYGEAIDWFQSSLALSQSLGARSLVAKTMGNLGWCYYRMGDLDTALRLFTGAETLSAQLGLQKDQLRWLIDIGLIHWDRAELDDAQSYYLRALRMAKQLDIRSNWASCLNDLALVAIKKKQFDDAERYDREALEMARANKDRVYELHALFTDARIKAEQGAFQQAKELLRHVIDDSNENFSLKWIAQARLASIYATLKEPALADQQFRKSLNTINQARAALNREEYRLTFLSSEISFYNDYVAFLVGQEKIGEALHVVELNRARTLSEGLQLKQNTDSLFAASFNPEQTARRMGSVILSYWLAPEHSYLWAVTAAGVKMFVLPPQAEIEQTVHNYRAALAGPRDVLATQNASGQKLYEMLLAPAEKLISNNSRVVIIPSGSLYELNFETLLVPGNQLHYWIEDVIVTNASSLLLLEKAVSKHPMDEKNILLIGDAVSPNPEYTALPQAASEIDQVKKYFPAEKAQVYQRQTATAKAYVEGNPGRFSFIHFVAHGVASRESPLDSAVILSGDENSYKLYAREIIKIPLHANLVTISSCQGAAGRTYAGEGLVGLSWAFLRAGAHQVIAALWEVNDASTPQFMDQFYAGVSAGSDPAVALRAAKLAMLHSDSVYRRPFYWAPFQLYKGL